MEMETITELAFTLIFVLVLAALGFGLAFVFMRFNLMKPLYRLALLGGVLMLVLLGLLQGRVGTDRYVARVLSESPEGWTMSVNDEVKARLAPFQLDVKEQVRRALTARSREGWTSPEGLLYAFSSIVILFSVVGLRRERNLEKLRKQVEVPGSSAPGSPGAALV